MVIVLPVATPLCPAGHLPLKGGDRMELPSCPQVRSRRTITSINIVINMKSALSAAQAVNVWRRSCALPISPLEGEMPGRAEGGKPRREARS
ncbi:hypothetical protein F4V89_00025 [Neorhizobium galegae]|nr:hypothetical protein F4V88_00295 [Neorhizobium galegae]KAB1116297.1 hypothetical protein F4V89_00025 [Neorhizobium galegae]